MNLDELKALMREINADLAALLKPRTTQHPMIQLIDLADKDLLDALNSGLAKPNDDGWCDTHRVVHAGLRFKQELALIASKGCPGIGPASPVLKAHRDGLKGLEQK